MMFPWVLLVIFVTCSGTDVYISRSDGLYSADLNRDNFENIQLTKPSSGGETIALAIDTHASQIFWSDTTKGKAGIYKGTMTSSGISSESQIVTYDGDVIVTSLAVDWVYRHLYWASVPHSYVMVADYDGNNRVVAVTTELLLPGGIAVDPKPRHLYLGDQGSQFMLRCQMDGLFECQNIDRRQYNQIVWPNQLYMEVSLRILSWTDGWSSKVVSCLSDLTDCQETVVTPESSSSVFGLVYSGSGLIAANLDSFLTYTIGSNVSREYSLPGNTYYIVSSDTSTQPQPSETHVCMQNNGECSQLCFPDGVSARCTCASYSNAVLTDAKICQRPDEVFLYIDGSKGHVGMLSTSLIGHTLLAYTQNPTSLAYDPLTKTAFFSDATYQAIYNVSIDGGYPAVFLSQENGIGSVEAMTVDRQQHRLYFLNKFQWEINNDSRTMVIVEMAGISKPEERLTVLKTGMNITDIEIIHGTSSYLYYAVGMPTPSIYQMFMDGLISTRLRLDVTSPTRLSSIGDTLLILDNTSAGLVLIQYNGRGTPISTPLPNQVAALTSGGRYVYLSNGRSLLKFDTDSNIPGDHVALEINVNNLLYINTQETYQPDPGLCHNADLCKTSSVCIKTNNAEIARCKCPSDKLNTPINGTRSCTVPTNYLLFSDVDGIKMTSLDDVTAHDIYTIIPNQDDRHSYHGLTTDGTRVYFAGYNGKTIYTAANTGEDVKELRVLDKMTVLNLAYFDNTLYWTGHYDCYYYTNISDCESYKGLLGGVFSLDVNTTSSSDSPVSTFVANIVNPHGVAADASALYWSESDRVRRLSRINSFDTYTIMHKRFYSLQQNARHTHIYGGGRDITFRRFTAQRFEHQVLFSGVSNVRGMAIKGSLLFASDWDNQNIIQYDLRTHLVSIVAETFGRPGQMVVVGMHSPIQVHLSLLTEEYTGCYKNTCQTDKSGSCPQVTANLCEPSFIACQDDVDCIDTFKSKCCLGNTQNTCVKECTSPSPETACNITFKARSTLTWGYEKITSECETCGCSTEGGSLIGRCSSVQCPPLTGCMYNVTLPQECCPVCPYITACTEKPTIHGCQSVGTIMLQLRETLPDIRDQPVTFTIAAQEQISSVTAYSCNSQEIPSIRWTFIPSKVVWKEDIQMVKLAVSDYTGVTYCEIKVMISDTTPPAFISSLNGTVTNVPVKDKNGIKLEWISPIAADNSGCKSTVTSNEPHGVTKPPGWHPIRYLAMDGAGNDQTIEFYFNVSVVPDLTCEPPPLFHHGTMECSKDQDGVVSCSAYCLPRFLFKSKFQKKYRCVQGQWQPDFDEDFATACFEPQPFLLSFTTLINLNCTPSSVSPNNVIECLQTGGQCVTEGTVLCDRRAITVQREKSSVTIQAHALATVDYNEQAIQDTVGTLLDKLTSVERFFSGRKLDQFCPSVACRFDKLGGRTIGRSCEDGAIIYLVDDEDICGTCPVGTRFKSSNGTPECEKCPENWYQDEEGQTDCKQCPTNMPYSRTGTWLVERCNRRTKRKERGLMTIVIGVLAGFM